MTSETEMEFAKYFEDVTVVKMHLFSPAKVDSTEYPYFGKLLPVEAINHLEKKLAQTNKQGLYACYKMQEGFYLLRAPNDNLSNALVLCRWDKEQDKLVQTMPLSFSYCREGICHQQDAWLTDLDLDNQLELITRSREKKENKDAPSNLTFKVLMQDGSGKFVPGKKDIVNYNSYVFEDIF